MAAEGAPSSNSSVPSRLSTRSGVEIERSVSAETPFFFFLLAVLIPLTFLSRMGPLRAWDDRINRAEPDRIIRSR